MKVQIPQFIRLRIKKAVLLSRSTAFLIRNSYNLSTKQFVEGYADVVQTANSGQAVALSIIFVEQV